MILFTVKSKKKQIIRTFIVILIALGLILLLVKIFSQPTKLPGEFLSARKEAADVSQKIVELTNTTNEKIKAVNESDLRDSPNKAILLIGEARTTNNEAYKKAFELSQHLQKLAESLATIKAVRSQRSAYEAVAVELSLVTEFISYTQSLNNFFDSLSRAIATNSLVDRQLTDGYLKEVNTKANTINDLNRQFLAKISEFDKTF